ncbi:MAG: hypothetical protein KF809_08605 [Chloroflexi bacterium]|nr:hypothetical protein [Chloroflexota bacterium]
MFDLGSRYTRQEIHREVGGDLQSYLPSRGGEIVAACLEPRKNPDAPTVILPGIGPGRERDATRLVAQGGAVPVFLKRGSKAWEYVGDHRVVRSSQDPAEIAAQGRRSGRADITRVIVMTEVGH